MKFVKDTIKNETLGVELRDTLVAQGYKALTDLCSIDDMSISLKIDSAEYRKCRKIVIEFLNSLGYVKKVSGSSGATFLNTEDNSKRVYYNVDLCKHRVRGFDELQDYVSVFVIFETR